MGGLRGAAVAACLASFTAVASGCGEDACTASDCGPPSPDDEDPCRVPSELVATLVAGEGIAASDGHVIWMDGGRVFAAVGGDPSTARLVMDVGGPEGSIIDDRLTTRDGYVYASGTFGIFRALVADEYAEPERLADPVARVAAIAVVPSGIYLGRQDWVSDRGSLLRVRLEGDGSAEVLREAGHVFDVQADGDEIVWADVGAPASEHGAIGRIGADGSMGAEQPADGVRGLGVDAAFLYFWLGRLMRMPRLGGAPEPVAEAGRARVLVAGEGLYVSDEILSLVRLDGGSGAPTIECAGLAPDAAGVAVGDATNLAMDDEFVYVQTSVPGGPHPGVIARVPRRR